MKYIIIGHGKMGKAVDEAACNKGHKLIGVIDNESDWLSAKDILKSADIAFEFTQPEKAVANIKRCFEYKLPVVCGTTGWFEELDKIKTLCVDTENALFFAGNFSIGVNIIMEINRQLADIMNNMPQYNVMIEETHHIHKLDAPSGTAVILANDILSKIKRLNNISTLKTNVSENIDVISYREGEVTGIHNIIYNSNVDKIELKHTSKNRQGLAQGAVIAAEWLLGKKGVFSMYDLLGFGNK